MAKYAVFPDIENLDVLLLGHFIAWPRSSDFLVLGLLFPKYLLTIIQFRPPTFTTIPVDESC
jgi:hypothetical protein